MAKPAGYYSPTLKTCLGAKIRNGEMKKFWSEHYTVPLFTSKQAYIAAIEAGFSEKTATKIQQRLEEGNE